MTSQIGYRYQDEKREHLHSFDGKPLIGTSTVCSIIGKGDGLTWWAAGMSIGKLGWIKKSDSRTQEDNSAVRLESAAKAIDRIRGLTKIEYLKLLDEAYKAHDTYKRERALIGTARHAALEFYVKNCINTNEGKPLPGVFENEFVQKFADWAVINIKKFLWSEMHCYSTTLWVGGIADIGWIDNDDRVIVADFKSSKDAFFNQFIQIAGYDVQIAENGGYTKDGEKMFNLPSPTKGYCVIPFGADIFKPVFINDVEGYREGFKNVIELYKLNQTYG